MNSVNHLIFELDKVLENFKLGKLDFFFQAIKTLLIKFGFDQSSSNEVCANLLIALNIRNAAIKSFTYCCFGGSCCGRQCTVHTSSQSAIDSCNR